MQNSSPLAFRTLTNWHFWSISLGPFLCEYSFKFISLNNRKNSSSILFSVDWVEIISTSLAIDSFDWSLLCITGNVHRTLFVVLFEIPKPSTYSIASIFASSISLIGKIIIIYSFVVIAFALDVNLKLDVCAGVSIHRQIFFVKLVWQPLTFFRLLIWHSSIWKL